MRGIPHSYAKPVDKRRYRCTILITRFFSIQYFSPFFLLLYNITNIHTLTILFPSLRDLDFSIKFFLSLIKLNIPFKSHLLIFSAHFYLASQRVTAKCFVSIMNEKRKKRKIQGDPVKWSLAYDSRPMARRGAARRRAASPVDRKARNIRWFLRRGQHCDCMDRACVCASAR